MPFKKIIGPQTLLATPVRSISRTNEGKYVKFRKFSATHLTIEYPARVKSQLIYINKRDGLKLAR